MDQMVEVVELMKPERAGLGLLIWEQGEPGVYVKEVVKNRAAYNDRRIQPGDKILAINGQDISNAGQSVVYQMLQVWRWWCTQQQKMDAYYPRSNWLEMNSILQCVSTQYRVLTIDVTTVNQR